MTAALRVPELRVRALNSAEPRANADYVLYWMVAFRRSTHNFALDRALEVAREYKLPVLVLEALRCDYGWASDRLHHFVLDGMSVNRAAFEAAGVAYHAYVEPTLGAGRGLMQALSERAALVVTDDYPCFFLPQMTAALAERVAVRVEAVDSNGLIPLRAFERSYVRAFDFRKQAQRLLCDHAQHAPAIKLTASGLPPLTKLPKSVRERWPAASMDLLSGKRQELARLPIDHTVERAPARGGAEQARATLKRFLRERLDDYDEARNHPDAEATSQLSPYLHFGHISAHEILKQVLTAEDSTLSDLRAGDPASAKSFWGMRPGAVAFLDQLLTWRELGFNFSSFRPDEYARYDGLPAWALKSLMKHRKDAREVTYSRQRLEQAETGDELWNAAQRELVRTGHMHNYLRMLWGKLVIGWSRSPEAAFETLVELNNKYALDGRDPNSYSGIAWCFGRFDRAWGPERPVYGLLRYMTSASARRKLKLKEYLLRFA